MYYINKNSFECITRLLEIVVFLFIYVQEIPFRITNSKQCALHKVIFHTPK